MDDVVVNGAGDGGGGAGGAGEQKKGLLFIAFHILLTLQYWLIRSEI